MMRPGLMIRPSLIFSVLNLYRTKIMDLNGLKFEMYCHASIPYSDSVNKFCHVADELIAKNRAQHSWIEDAAKKHPDKYEDRHSKADPAFASEFYYVHDEGRPNHVCIHFLTFYPH